MENNRTKVLILVTKGNFGGAQRYVFDLATHLPKKDFEVLVASGEGESLGLKLSEKNIRSIDIESLGREVEAGRDWKAFKEIRALIKRESPDIAHFNSSKMGLLGALAVITLKIENEFIHGKDHKLPKTIFTGHGWAHHEKQRSFFWRSAFYVLHYLTMLLCDQTILVADMLKDDYRFLPFLKNKINTVHNGINAFRPDAKESARRELLQGKDGRKYVLFSLSELHPNKGIDTALKAISLLPQSVRSELLYVIAGSGEDKVKLETQISDLKLEDVVCLMGFVDNGKRLLSGADIFLLPSRKEAYPYALLEAGSVGLPIIATSVGGIPEIIHDMQNGILVHKENPRELAEAILYVLENKTKKGEFGQEIKRTVLNFFSLEKMMSDTIEVYNKLISKV